MLQYAALTAPGMMMLKRDWMTMTEVAEVLGVNRTTAWRWVESGRLKLATKQTPGGRWLYRRADLEAWLNVSDVDLARIQDTEERAKQEEKQAERDARERARQEARERGIKDQKPRNK